MKNKLKYWFPRLIILGVAASMPFSAPKFITTMDEAEFIVWLLRVLWVLAFPTAFCVVLFLTLWVQKLNRRRKGSLIKR